MSDSSQPGIEATRRTRRRQNFREIALPFSLGVLALVGIVLLVAVLPRPGTSSFVATLLGTLFFLCPLALCLFPFTILMVAAIYGLGRVNDAASRPLIAVERLAIRANQTVERYGKRIADRTMDLSSAYEQFDRAIISKLDQTDQPPSSTGKREHD